MSEENSEFGIQDSGGPTSRAPARTFQDLVVWQQAHQFVLAVYALTKGLPPHELYSLASQFRRAAVSIPANIAEDFKKRGKSDKARLLNIAQGSLEECRYYCVLVRDLGYGDTAALLAQLESVSRLLTSYHNALLTSEF